MCKMKYYRGVKLGKIVSINQEKQLGLRWTDVSIWLQLLRLIAIELLAIRRIARARLSAGAQFVGNRNATKEWLRGGVATGDGKQLAIRRTQDL